MRLSDYLDLWEKCTVDPSRSHEIELAVTKLLAGWQKYSAVKKETDIPEHVTGVIHYRESDFSFGTWLANGDPLFDHDGHALKTRHVPVGLGPVTSWEEGAILSFHHERFDTCIVTGKQIGRAHV